MKPTQKWGFSHPFSEGNPEWFLLPIRLCLKIFYIHLLLICSGNDLTDCNPYKMLKQ